MSTVLLVVMLGSDAQTHAAEPGKAFALCGMYGRTLLVQVHGAGDVACDRCADLVVDALGLTALTDPTNVQMRVVEDQ